MIPLTAPTQTQSPPIQTQTPIQFTTPENDPLLQLKQLQKTITSSQEDQQKSNNNSTLLHQFPQEVLLRILKIVAYNDITSLMILSELSPFDQLCSDKSLWPEELDFSPYWDRLTDSNLYKVIKSLNHVKSINFSKCRDITDLTLAAIGQHCISIQKLSFQYCSNLRFVGFSWMTQRLGPRCSQIRYLDVSYCPKLGVAFCRKLSKTCRGISTFIVNGNSIIAKNLTALDGIGRSLRVFQCNSIKSRVPNTFALDLTETFPNLIELSLNNVNGLVHKMVSTICHSLSLIKLNIAGNKLSDETMNIVSQNLSEILTRVNISDNLVKSVFPSTQYLVRIDAVNCPFLESSAFQLLRGNTTLTFLNLQNCVLDDDCLNVISQSEYSEKLTTFWLTSFKIMPIRDIGFIPFIRSCPNLVDLRLTSSLITNKSIIILSQSCPQLKSISLARTPEILSPLAARYIVHNLPDLEALNLQGVNISHKALFLLLGLFTTNPPKFFSNFATIPIDNDPFQPQIRRQAPAPTFSDQDSDDDTQSTLQRPRRNSITSLNHVFNSDVTTIFSGMKSEYLTMKYSKIASFSHIHSNLSKPIPFIAYWAEKNNQYISLPPKNDLMRQGLKKLKTIKLQLCPLLSTAVMHELLIYFQNTSFLKIEYN